MPRVTLEIQSENAASRDILRLRSELNSLGRQIAENNQRAVDATAEERRAIQEKNRSLRASQGLLRAEQQRQSISLAGLRQNTGLLAQARTGTQTLTRATNLLGGALATLGFAALATEVTQFVGASIRASNRVEGFRNSLTALYGDAQIAENVLMDLRDASQLPGITFEGAVQGAVRLKTVGIEGDRALGVITQFGNAAALSGASAEELGRALVGLTQTVARGQIEQDNLNQILENVPLIGNAIRESFNSIDSETIREQLDAAGQSTQDFVDILVNQLSMGARASAETTANAFSNLGNATFQLQAAIGSALNPAVRAVTLSLTELLENTTELITRVSSAREVLDNVSEGVMALDASLSNTASIAARNTAIQGYISVLETAQENLQSFIDFERDIQDNRQQGAFGAFTSTATDLSDEIAQIGLLGEEIEQFQGILEGSATSLDFFEGIVSDLGQSIQREQGNISQYRQQQQRLADAGESGSEAYSELNDRIIQSNGVITALRSELGRYNAIVALGEENINRTSLAVGLLTASQEANEQAVKDAGTALRDGTAAHLEYIQASIATREHVEALSEAQEALNTFWQVASGEIGDYSASIQTIIPSIVNITNEQDALTAVFNEQSVAINENRVALDEETQALLRYLAQNDALDESLANVERRLDAHNAALVDPAIEEAIRRVESLDTHFESVADISDMVTASVRDQALAFDELRRSVDGVSASQSRLPGQQIGSDLVDASTPGYTRNAGFFDPRISGDFNYEDNLRELGRNLGDFTEGFTFDINSIVRAMEGTGDPFDAFESAIVSINPALGIFTTGIRLLGEEFEEAERARRDRREFERLGGDVGPRESFSRSRLGGGISGTDLPDPTGRIVEAFGGFYDIILRDLQENLNQAQFNLDFAELTGGDIQGAVQGVIATTTDFYQHQIDEINRVRRETGEVSFGDIGELARELQRLTNEARLALESTSNVTRFTPVTEQGRTPGTRFNASTGQFEQIPTAGSESAAPIGSRLPEETEAEAEERIEIERETQERILAIQERAIQARASNEQRLQDDIRGIADSVVAFHERTERRKVEISERATEDRQRIEQRLQDDIRGIADDVVAFHTRTQEQITAVQERATADRLRVEDTYNQDVQQIADDVVAFHTRTQEQITAVQERATADRLRVEDTYNQDVQQIADDVVAFHTRTQEQITAVQERATADRIAVENRYSDDVQGIYDDVADRYGDSEAEKVAITERATADRLRAEENYGDTVQGIVNGLVDNVRGIQDQIIDAEMQAVQERITAQMDYNDEVQGIYNNLASEIMSIEERLNDDLDRIGEQRVAAEQSRLESIARLNRESRASISGEDTDIRRGIEDALSDAFGIEVDQLGARGFSVENLLSQLTDSTGLIQSQRFGDLFRGGAFSGLGNLGDDAFSDLESQIADLLLARNRNIEDIEVRAAAERVRIQEQAAAEQAALTTQEGTAITGAAMATGEAEATAGTTAAEALMNAVPPLDAMSMASMNLATTLTTIDTNLATDVGAFNDAITNLETDAGISFENALMQYTPSLSAMAEAGQTFADAIGGINTQELADLANVDTNFAAFVEAAGVTLPEALANASPPMTRLAIAMENLDTGIAGVNEREIDDISTLNTSLDTFVAMAGIPLTEALNLASPPMTRLAIAMENLDVGIAGVNEQETDDITALTTGFDNFVNMAGIPLTEALNLASPPMTRLAAALESRDEGLLSIDEQETAAITMLTTGMSDFVAMAGIPLTEALTLASPPMTLLAAALGRRDTGISGVDEGEATELATEDTAFADFVQAAGIDLPSALNLASPVLSRHAAALEGFNQRAFGIDTQETTDLADFGVLPGSVQPPTTPSPTLDVAQQMQATPAVSSSAIMASVAQQQAAENRPIAITGEVSIRGGVEISGTVPITTAEPIQAFVVNFPEGGQTAVIQFPSGAAYEVANEINLGIQAGEVVGF